ncbi:PIR protein [Plasmodium yoelii]|uniref:PIR protein n=2 Tax=Plasmodium yoelii TaxID=5861 RepID=A0AAE9X0G7_PLAYO|nr:PIR protein [Plasmodium yoelii]WBY59663.1 PIR protein [Plasmodium yoelii yoelii]VTZ80402.1 PIR protein [Plasmodium yoelii]|eukprot:XP_022813465.1 PIR protein [Plasmodium yoelii]
MNDSVCRTFLGLRNSFSNNLDGKGDYQFIMNKEILNGYCTNKNCSSNLDKINAGSLYLFDAFFKDSTVFKNHNSIHIVEYILLWLSYMLNLKEQVGMTNLQYFYNMYVLHHEKYKNSIIGVDGYTSYKDLIDQKKYLLGMDKQIISNFYEVFKLLCDMYTNFDAKTSHCSNCSQNANTFVKKYNQMNKNSVITSNSSYNKLLSTLSNEYNNFKNYYTSKGGNSNDIPSLTSIENMQASTHISGQDSEDTPSSSSIPAKLFTVLSIFGAIAFFLGISYKYSLFGVRKRFKKQQIREKIKNIKKKMNQ